GTELEPLKSKAEALRIAPRVHFAGFSNSVDDFFAAADVYAMTSILESFGLTLIRALGHGLPVLARRYRYPHVLTASDDIVEDGFNGRLFDSVNELAAAVNQMVSDASLRNRMGLNAIRS